MAEDGERIAFTAPAVPDVLDHAHAELEELWTRHPEVPGADRARFETGLVEILGNVVEHAFGARGAVGRPSTPARQVSVVVTFTPAILEAVIEDDGRPVQLDLGSVTMPGPDAESGRGLALAAATLDSLTHVRLEGRNRWTMHCRF